MGRLATEEAVGGARGSEEAGDRYAEAWPWRTERCVGCGVVAPFWNVRAGGGCSSQFYARRFCPGCGAEQVGEGERDGKDKRDERDVRGESGGEGEGERDGDCDSEPEGEPDGEPEAETDSDPDPETDPDFDSDGDGGRIGRTDGNG